jgi:hypothetical protein
MKTVVFCLISIIFGFCSIGQTGNLNKKRQTKEIILQEDVRIIIPLDEKSFSDSNIYSHIEIWIDSKKVFSDTSTTEYLFDNKGWPQARKINNGGYEILIEVFDAPDFNKLQAWYFKDYLLVKMKVLPFFDKKPEDVDNDGMKEYSGVMHIADAYENSDSCYYNPILYYQITNQEIDMDSTLTIKMNKKIWGEFYGFEQSEKVIPCSQ